MSVSSRQVNKPMFLCCALLIGGFGLLVTGSVLRGAAADVEVLRPTEQYRLLTLQLENVLEGGEPIELHVGLRGRHASHSWVTFPLPETARRQAAGVSALRFDGERLEGEVMLRLEDVHRIIKLRAEVTGAELLGTWSETYGRPEPNESVRGTIKGVSPEEEGQAYLFELVEALCLTGNDRRDLRIILSMKDGKLVRAYAKGRYFNTATHEVDASGLSISSDGIRGSVRVQVLPDQWVPAHGLIVCAEYKIDATIQDGLVSGGDHSGTYGIERTHEGKLTGRIRDGEQLQRENAVAKDKGWPAWPGPFGGLFAQPGGYELVDDLRHAQLIWRSEAQDTGGGKVQPGWGHVLGGQIYPYGRGWKTGGATPIVADGRVYLFYTIPTGDKYAISQEETREGEASYADNPTKRFFTQSYAIDADDIVLCMDAATGQTLWKTVFRSGGAASHGRKGGPNLTVCVGGDKVFGIGTLDQVYCLDAEDGKLLWQSPLPGHERRLAAKADSLQKGASAGQYRNGGPAFAEGVLALYDSGELRAYDAAAGRVLWSMKEVHNTHHPVLWYDAGKTYVIGASGNDLFCAELRSGSILWQTDAESQVDRFADAPSLLIHGNYLLSRAASNGRVTVFRLSSQGAKRTWQRSYRTFNIRSTPPLLDDRFAYVPSDGPESSVARFEVVELATGRVVRRAEEIAWPRLLFPVGGDGRLMSLIDWSHNLSDMRYVATKDGSLCLQRERWVPPHPNVGSYSSVMLPPYVDGRLFFRGYNGVYCYDLRKQPAR